MSTDRDTTRIVRSWLRTEENESADRVLGTVLDRLDTTPQRGPTRGPARRLSTMNTMLRFGLAAAVMMVAALIGINYLANPDVGGPGPAESMPMATANSTPEQSEAAGSATASSAAVPSLANLGLPGMSPNEPAGEYGWETGQAPSGMHRVIEVEEPPRESTAMLFASGPECLGDAWDDRDARDVRVAGFDGVVVEPYEPVKTFNPPKGDEVTRAYALAVQDRTLCVFVTWHSSTTEDELREAVEILDTIRAEPIGSNGVRMTFTLPAGWDTG